MPNPSPTHRGRIVEWNAAKGWGFVEAGGQRMFLHRREIRQLPRAPVVGDSVGYEIGVDPKGRKCAKNAELTNPGPAIAQSVTARGQFEPSALVVLAVLLVAPLWAAMQGPSWMDWRWVAGWSAAMSLLTYLFYAIDKRRAREQEWRTPESALHFCELVGGWPGAFVAQRRLRHKAVKFAYQFWFWVIVAGYQYVAIDSLIGWKMTRRIAEAVREIMN